MAELPVTLVKKKSAKSVRGVGVLRSHGWREGCASPMVTSTGQCAERVRKPWCAKEGTPPTSLSIFKTLHSDLYKEATQGKTDTSKGNEPATTQPTLTTVIEEGRKYDPKSLPAKELDRAVAYYIAKDMQPYSIVESPGFRALVCELNPQYKLPLQKYFTQHEIPELEICSKGLRPKIKLLYSIMGNARVVYKWF